MEAGLARLITRWNADENPNLAGLLASYLEQVQDLEDAIWKVLIGRMPDYAEGASLDMLGKIVGERRNGALDEAFRTRIKARIAVNQSFGRPADIIGVLRIVDSVAFHLTEFDAASFFVTYDEPPTTSGIGAELPGIIAQTRAAGVSGLVAFPVDRVDGRGAFFGSAYDHSLNAARGFSSSYDPSVGGLYGHAARS